MVFEDPRSREILSRIERIAPSDAPVLVTGETGTGKELVAREIHARSRRADRPFVAVNAGAFSENLIESELFGHERGAFTGAVSSKAGWFEAAHGGTLFLDEIGDLPLSLQVKLLRVLQEGEVTRIGSRSPTAVDVRLIAATNVDLHAAIRARHFREDLYYRLRVTTLTLPPLRDRPGDILPLARYFLAIYEKRLGQSSVRLAPGAIARLVRHTWPGNIRELENTIHHALLVCEGRELTEADLQLGAVPNTLPVVEPAAPEPRGLDSLEQALLELLDSGTPDLYRQVESCLFSTVYRYSDRNQLETARLLGLSRHVVRARLIEQGQLPGPLRRSRASEPPEAEPRRLQPGPPNAAVAPRSRIRIGYQKLGLLMLAKAHGGLDAALSSRGVEVEWREFSGGMQIVDALASRDLELAIVGDCPAVIAQAADVPIVYLAAEPPAPRGAALIVPRESPFQDVAELRGRSIAVNRAAQAHYLLLRALEEAGLDAGDVEICFQTPEQAFTAFRAGAVDAWAIWDPWLSSARLDFGARVLRDATGLLKNSAYYVARRAFAESEPELVRQFLSELRAAAHWVKRDPERAATLVAPELGVSSRALIASLERDLATVPLDGELLAAQQDVADTLLRLRLIPHAVSVAEALWPLKLAG
jgi:aliphatic sulfonates family ABC transporter substrate-binding protein